MSIQSNISNDAQYLAKTNMLAELKHQQEKSRPAVYFLFTIVMVVIFMASAGSAISLFAAFFGLASLLAGITAAIKRNNLGGQIRELEAELKLMESAKPRENSSISETTSDVKDSASSRLAELKSMLDKNLISQQEYDSKRTDILNRL